MANRITDLEPVAKEPWSKNVNFQAGKELRKRLYDLAKTEKLPLVQVISRLLIFALGEMDNPKSTCWPKRAS